MKPNKDYWSTRYEQENTGWDLGQVSPPLKAYIDGLRNPDIKILIPGAGNAYEAEYLHRQGFTNVFVIDIAEKPLKKFQERVPTFPSKNLITGDFFKLNSSYDLILEQTFFCALPVSQRPMYVKKMHSLLKQNGTLAGVLFNTNFDGPVPPFGGNKEAYITYFSPLFQITILEPCYNSIGPRQ